VKEPQKEKGGQVIVESDFTREKGPVCAITEWQSAAAKVRGNDMFTHEAQKK